MMCILKNISTYSSTVIVFTVWQWYIITSPLKYFNKISDFNFIMCFFLYYISSKSGFDELFSESLQTNPAIPVHKVILIPINVFLTNDFSLHDSLITMEQTYNSRTVGHIFVLGPIFAYRVEKDQNSLHLRRWWIILYLCLVDSIYIKQQKIKKKQ